MLAPGTSLGPYEIVAPLGAGGMGEVYRARDTRLGRDVAVKVLTAGCAADADRLRRFEQEARAAGALDHPNVCAIHDVGTHAGAPFVVMELLEGESLRARLAAGALPVRKALDYAAQAALGLAAAHGKGIVHRDLKPENLFVTRDGRVKILDFGLAKQSPDVASGPQSDLPTRDGGRTTRMGAVLGTVGYMSPEQARGEAADARSDIFSFGCVLYEMLGGRPPFARPSAAETVSAILKEEPGPLSSASGSLPRAVERTVTRCLEKRPEDRFASASDLQFALQSLLQSSAFESGAEAPTERSIVVLPFENLSPDPENAFFADGLTEEIITDLARLRAVRVISRTSAMLLRGSKKDVPAIARDLRVRYVLEGSVRRAGQSLRVTAQLIDAASDTHLWADKYAGSLEDVFDMQEKVSRAIVEALRLELTPQEHERLAERPIPNVYAYECYLRARAALLRYAVPPLDEAGKHLEQGLRILPDNPLLLAGLGYVHFQRVNIGIGGEEDLVMAEALATRALRCDPELPQGRLVLGLAGGLGRGRLAAITQLERVLSTDPNDQDALMWLGVFYAHGGRLAEAAALGERLIAIDPIAPMSYAPLALAHWMDGRFDEALGVMERAGRLDPGLGIWEDLRVLVLIAVGRRGEAVALADRIEKGPTFSVFDRVALLWRYAAAGEPESALRWMTPEALETCRRSYQKSWWVAGAYLMLGDADSALDWLENSIERGFVNHRYLAEIDPILARLRGDARFQALMARAKALQAEMEVQR